MTEVDSKIQTTSITNLDKEGPKKWDVVFYNDDSTPMNYVIGLLKKIFGLNDDLATELTLRIHHENSAVVASYFYEIAEQRAGEALYDARTNGYPLKIEIHPKI